MLRMNQNFMINTEYYQRGDVGEFNYSVMLKRTFIIDVLYIKIDDWYQYLCKIIIKYY